MLSADSSFCDNECSWPGVDKVGVILKWLSLNAKHYSSSTRRSGEETAANIFIVVSWGFCLTESVRVVFLCSWGWDEALSWQTFLPRGFCTMCTDVNLLAYIKVRWVSSSYNVPVWMVSKLFGLNNYFFSFSICLLISLNWQSDWSVNQCQWYRSLIDTFDTSILKVV